MEPRPSDNPYQPPKTGTLKPADRRGWPALVRLGLAGLSTRKAAWGWFAVAVLLTVAFAISGFFNPRLFGGCCFAVAALWYYLAIHWVDQHARWHDEPSVD